MTVASNDSNAGFGHGKNENFGIPAEVLEIPSVSRSEHSPNPLESEEYAKFNSSPVGIVLGEFRFVEMAKGSSTDKANVANRIVRAKLRSSAGVILTASVINVMRFPAERSIELLVRPRVSGNLGLQTDSLYRSDRGKRSAFKL